MPVLHDNFVYSFLRCEIQLRSSFIVTPRLFFSDLKSIKQLLDIFKCSLFVIMYRLTNSRIVLALISYARALFLALTKMLVSHIISKKHKLSIMCFCVHLIDHLCIRVKVTVQDNCLGVQQK